MLYKASYSYGLHAILLNPSLRVAWPGTETFFKHFPLNENVYTLVFIVYIAALICTLLGYKTKYALIILFIVSIYILGLGNIHGKINHSNHHFVALIGILMFSPCAQVLAIDSWHKKQIKSYNYEIVFKFIWAVFALAYFFPGYYKLILGGINFNWANGLQNILYQKWFEFGTDFLPLIRIDLHPNVLYWAGVATIVFELSFIAAVILPKIRSFMLITAIFFHLGIKMFMNISFINLWACLLPLFDWWKILKPLNLKTNKTVTIQKYALSKSFYVVSIFFIVASALAGFIRFDSWPVGIYPTFAYAPSAYIVTIRPYIITKEGMEPLPLHWNVKNFGGYFLQREAYSSLVLYPERCNQIWNIASMGYNIQKDAVAVDFIIEKRLLNPEKLIDPSVKIRICRANLGTKS